MVVSDVKIEEKKTKYNKHSNYPTVRNSQIVPCVSCQVLDLGIDKVFVAPKVQD